MPKIPLKPPQDNEGNCQWANTNLPLFNQKTQRIKFRFRNCLHAPKTFEVVGGNKVYMLQKIGYLPNSSFNVEVLRIEKLGSDTPMSFMKTKLPHTGLESGLCEIIRLSDKVWRLKSNFKPDMELLFDKPETINVAKLPPDPCGEFAEFPGKFFAFEQGIAFSIGGEGVGQSIDLNSVVYENNG